MTSDPTTATNHDVDARPNYVRTILVAMGLLVAGLGFTVFFGIPVALIVGALGYGLDSNAFVVGTFVCNGLAFGTVAVVYLRRWLDGVPMAFPRDTLGLIAGVTAVSVIIALGGEIAYTVFGGPLTSGDWSGRQSLQTPCSSSSIPRCRSS